MARPHTYARTNEEEELALALAISASLSEDSEKSTPNGRSEQGSRQPQRQAPSYPQFPAAALHGSHGPQEQFQTSPGDLWNPAASTHPPASQPPLPAAPPPSRPLAAGLLSQLRRLLPDGLADPQARPAPAQQQQQQQQQPQQLKQPHQQGPGGSGGGGGGLLDPLRRLAGDAGSCAGCSAWLGVGPTLSALGRRWHPGCFRCAACGDPIRDPSFSLGPRGDQAYHPACHKRLHHPLCSVCGAYVPQRPDGRIEWRESGFWGSRYCPAHDADGTPACCGCGRLAPRAEEWVCLQDGRSLCLDCVGSLVVDTKDAQPLYQEVLDFFVAQGMPHSYKPPLLLVEASVLNDYVAKEGGRAAGPVFHVRGLCVATVHRTIPSVVRLMGGGGGGGGGGLGVGVVSTALGVTERCSVSVILVVYGLPRLLAGSIIAHELMHAYLRMRHVAGLTTQVEEGLCQLMAQLWLDSQDAWARRQAGFQPKLLPYLSHQIRSDPSHEYGDGFRMALHAFQQRGLRPLVEAVVSARAWPPWALSD